MGHPRGLRRPRSGLGTALGRSAGFSKPVPSLVFAVAVTAGMTGLARAMRTSPTGTAYAVRVGLGASLTAAYAVWTGDEPPTVLRVLLLLGLVGCIAGLRLAHWAGASSPGAPDGTLGTRPATGAALSAGVTGLLAASSDRSCR